MDLVERPVAALTRQFPCARMLENQGTESG
jgi:hypothetical protein